MDKADKRRYGKLAALAVSFLLSFPSGAAELQTGDLLFCVGGGSAMSEAIVSSTSSESQLSFDHVALYYENAEGEGRVIEASPSKGVIEVALEDFLKEAELIDCHPGVVAKRLTIDFPIRQVVENARSLIGLPYDWTYLPDNERIYCSELIYEAFRDAEGQRIFIASPMNFRNERGELPLFWQELFQKEGVPVPEGELGTNPNDMSRDPRLKEVYRFF